MIDFIIERSGLPSPAAQRERGSVVVFRPHANAARFNHSARARTGMLIRPVPQDRDHSAPDRDRRHRLPGPGTAGCRRDQRRGRHLPKPRLSAGAQGKDNLHPSLPRLH